MASYIFVNIDSGNGMLYNGTNQGFLLTQISGHSPIKILEVLNISKLQDNFCIYWCEFHMPLIHMRSKFPVTKFGQQTPCKAITSTSVEISLTNPGEHISAYHVYNLKIKLRYMYLCFLIDRQFTQMLMS